MVFALGKVVHSVKSKNHANRYFSFKSLICMRLLSALHGRHMVLERYVNKIDTLGMVKSGQTPPIESL